MTRFNAVRPIRFNERETQAMVACNARVTDRQIDRQGGPSYVPRYGKERFLSYAQNARFLGTELHSYYNAYLLK